MVSKLVNSFLVILSSPTISSVSLIRPILAPQIGEKPLFFYVEFCVFLTWNSVTCSVLNLLVSKFFHIISEIFPSTLVSSVSLIRPLLAPKKGGKPLFYYVDLVFYHAKSCIAKKYYERSHNSVLHYYYDSKCVTRL